MACYLIGIISGSLRKNSFVYLQNIMVLFTTETYQIIHKILTLIAFTFLILAVFLKLY